MTTFRKNINRIRLRRAHRTHTQIEGSAERPRLSVFRSNKSIYAQLIDDVRGTTLVAASSREIKKEVKEKSKAAEQVGILLSKRALEAGIQKAVFDRGAYRYHGRVKALAEGARSGGLTL
ncbi:MAG: 50S ribosomal protein L18 [Patescibacteria group bacterium]|nr:50S ribosomal protein L18 [Patescibacteria group bacterium]